VVLSSFPPFVFYSSALQRRWSCLPSRQFNALVAPGTSSRPPLQAFARDLPPCEVCVSDRSFFALSYSWGLRFVLASQPLAFLVRSCVPSLALPNSARMTPSLDVVSHSAICDDRFSVAVPQPLSLPQCFPQFFDARVDAVQGVVSGARPLLLCLFVSCFHQGTQACLCMVLIRRGATCYVGRAVSLSLHNGSNRML
jgi:hypothetical protein